MEGIDEIEEIEIEKKQSSNLSNNPNPKSQSKGDQENEADAKADSEISKEKEIKKRLENKEKWEGFLGMKLLTFKEHESLTKKSKMYDFGKFLIIVILLVGFLSSVFYFISIFKDKNFASNIEVPINNTVNLPQDNINVPVNVQVNSTNNPVILVNATINIDKIIINST